MKVKAGSVSYSRTINLDNYENAKLSVFLEIENDKEGHEVTALDYEDAWRLAKEIVRQEAEPILEARRRIRAAKIRANVGALPRDLRTLAEQVLQEKQLDTEEDVDSGNSYGTE